MKNSKLMVGALLAGLDSSCGGGSNSPLEVANLHPIASAGPDQSVI